MKFLRYIEKSLSQLLEYKERGSGPVLKFSMTLCRVCQEEKEEELIDLGCHCRGGLAKAHQSCIETWFNTRGSNKCEICQQVAANVAPPESHAPVSICLCWIPMLLDECGTIGSL